MTDKNNARAVLAERIKAYWNERSTSFAALRARELSGPNAAAWKKYFAAKLPQLNRPLKILDVGTGTGFFAILLTEMGHTVTAIDLSEEMLAQASFLSEERGLKIDYRQSCAGNLSFADGSFDVVVSRNLTWTLPDLPHAYAEWYRVLTEKGVLLNFDCDYGHWQFVNGTGHAVHADVPQALTDECSRIKDGLAVSRESRPDYDIALLRRTGFSVVCYTDIRRHVHLDPEIQYDDLPFFALKGMK